MKTGKQKQLAHIVAGVGYILISFLALENNDNDLIFSIKAIVLGSLFLIVAALHTWLLKNFKQLSIFFIIIEALSMFYMAFTVFKPLSKSLYNLFLLAGVLYIILFVYFLIIPQKGKPRHHRRRRKISSDYNDPANENYKTRPS